MNNLTLIFNRFWVLAIASSFGINLILPCLPGLTHQHQKFSRVKVQLPLTITSSHQEKKPEVDFSGTGRPGQQTAGESRGNCPETKIPLTALIPTSNSGKTIAERPNFWVYVPYHSRQIVSGEFVLQDEQRRDIYRTQVDLDNTPGYLHQSLPTTVPALQIGKSYVWYFKLYCDSDESSSPLFVQGWIERVPIDFAMQQELEHNSTKLEQVYIKYNLWYDAIDLLNRSYFAEPNNLKRQNSWRSILQAETVQLNLPILKPVIQTLKQKTR